RANVPELEIFKLTNPSAVNPATRVQSTTELLLGSPEATDCGNLGLPVAGAATVVRRNQLSKATTCLIRPH
ncbi:MAG: hypothetical protein WCK17_13350, partial [Verrucomicrobiota bacterium]